MKAVIEFELPEEGKALNLALKSYKLHDTLCEIKEYLRSFKHRDLTKKEQQLIDEIKTEIFTIINEAGDTELL
jgi:hypothetical protein